MKAGEDEGSAPAARWRRPFSSFRRVGMAWWGPMALGAFALLRFYNLTPGGHNDVPWTATFVAATGAGAGGSPSAQSNRGDGPSGSRHCPGRGLLELEGRWRPPRPAAVSHRRLPVHGPRRRLCDDRDPQLSGEWPGVPAVPVRASDACHSSACCRSCRALSWTFFGSRALPPQCWFRCEPSACHGAGRCSPLVWTPIALGLFVGNVVIPSLLLLAAATRLRRNPGVWPPAQTAERHRLGLART